jgi:hypothetical protein
MKHIFLISVIIFSGTSIAFFRTNESLLVLFVFGLFYYRNPFKDLNKNLILALMVWLLYFIINSLVINSFHPFFMVTYIIKIIIAYWLIKNYGSSLLLNYENIIYFLAKLSLFFFVWEILSPDSIRWVFSYLDVSQNTNPESNYLSIIVHSIGGQEGNLPFPRNAGFTWEPGPFSCFLSLALFFNIIRNKSILKDKIKILILIITILTTQSTTGYLILLVLLVWFFWIFSKNSAVKFFSIGLSIIIAIILYLSIDLLNSKIEKESNQSLDELISNSQEYDISYAPGRFASFKLALIDFVKRPFFGIGGNTKLKYAITQKATVSTTNGIGNIMMRYGMFGVLSLLYLLYNSGKWLSDKSQIYCTVVFPIVILIIGFSFGIIESPLFVTILFLPFFKIKSKLIVRLPKVVRGVSYK